MSHARTRLRNAALTAVFAAGTVALSATPSYAETQQAAYAIDTSIVREVVYVQPLPDVGDIVDVGDLPSCDTPGLSYCIDVGSPVVGPLYVPNVDYDTVHVTDVVAYVNKYQVGVGSLGTNQFTCVTLVQPVASDPCAALGITPYEQVPLLAQPVDAYIPRKASEPLTSVTVCAATMNVNDGALTLPTFAVC